MKKRYWILVSATLIIVLLIIFLTLRSQSAIRNGSSDIISKNDGVAGITFIRGDDLNIPISNPVSETCLQTCDKNYPPLTMVPKAETTKLRMDSNGVSAIGDPACDNYTLDKKYKIDPSGPWPLVYTEGKCPNGESVERMSLAYGGNGLSDDGSLSGLSCVQDNIFWIQDTPGGWSDEIGGRTVEFYGPFKGRCGYNVYNKKNGDCKTDCANHVNN
jgi:hypothetical protein